MALRCGEVEVFTVHSQAAPLLRALQQRITQRITPSLPITALALQVSQPLQPTPAPAISDVVRAAPIPKKPQRGSRTLPAEHALGPAGYGSDEAGNQQATSGLTRSEGYPRHPAPPPPVPREARGRTEQADVSAAIDLLAQPSVLAASLTAASARQPLSHEPLAAPLSSLPAALDGDASVPRAAERSCAWHGIRDEGSTVEAPLLPHHSPVGAAVPIEVTRSDGRRGARDAPLRDRLATPPTLKRLELLEAVTMGQPPHTHAGVHAQLGKGCCAGHRATEVQYGGSDGSAQGAAPPEVQMARVHLDSTYNGDFSHGFRRLSQLYAAPPRESTRAPLHPDLLQALVSSSLTVLAPAQPPGSGHAH
mmetsp:Transcript_18585/g.47833  ORF Transcript_18585/g.47833 Transcript_18585/m.47833 type:complete len:364 (-) Transcript_18585:52-1143(-)